MNKQMSQKGLYMGAGVGIIAFALVGLLPGSFIGGAIGLSIATHIFGGPLGAELLPRVIVGAAMLFGVVVAGLVFIVGASSIGWLIGYAIDSSLSRTTKDARNASRGHVGEMSPLKPEVMSASAQRKREHI